MKECALGIDGGGTKTRAAIILEYPFENIEL